MSNSIEAWLANAFCSEHAAGNATGVVFPAPDAGDEFCRHTARALRAPDTAFLWPEDGGYRARFFSPAEGEMAMCGQGLIASDAVLRARGVPEGPIRFLTPVGPLSCEHDGAGKHWVRFPREQVKAEPSCLELAPFAGIEAGARVVDTGRRRAFFECPLEPLERLAPPASEVTRICRAHGLTGLCFFARTGDAKLRFRVFTLSLEGREDASTGGAAIGLQPLLEPRPEWRIEQGTGSRFGRGTLFLRGETDAVLVGGHVELSLEGRLVSPAPLARSLRARLSEAASRHGLRIDSSSPEALVRAVKSIPYGRARNRSPEAILEEWRGTCSGKHYLLAAVLAELEVPVELSHRVYRVSPALAAERFPHATSAMPRDGLTDVHTWARVRFPFGDRRIDVTFPGAWDGRSDLPLACGDGVDVPVPPGVDPQQIKEGLIRANCVPEVREAFIAALGRTDESRRP